MPADTFIDTNIFVYQLDTTDKKKARIADQLIRAEIAAGTACVSAQVIHEWMNVVLHKAKKPLTVDVARGYLDAVLLPLLRVEPSRMLVLRALSLRERWKYGVFDSLIIAAALEAGCRRLLSEDLQHGQQIETLKIENPFL